MNDSIKIMSVEKAVWGTDNECVGRERWRDGPMVQEGLLLLKRNQVHSLTLK